MTTSNLSPRFWKLLALLEIVDNVIPDPPLIVRTAITKKSSADSINLNRTKTSKQAREVEDQLAADLKREYNKIMADETKDFGVLQRRYGPDVEKVIRGAVQKLYLIGSDYSTKALNTTAFITQTDLTNIKKQVDFSTAAFWRRVSIAIHKKDVIIMPKTAQVVGEPTVPYPIDDTEPEPPDPDVLTTSLATILATMTLALSTLSKLDQIPVEEGVKRKLVWVTDGGPNVCNICQSLHGQEWDEGNSDIPIPIQDSHINCHCRLLVKMGEDILSG